ncbi:hypothetical protein HL653_11885 [Sphingomonas sp. AP4-R1]|uniref:hypothetical protein n=1 Tax=Sphingomonas sp. AP4-R1 TaxID=2735134 RepID=UPI0014935C32|nr:hypothetical protein [Sphingomonas sp. AP4-R1]QJU58379.1 hypothetical protein HL653_11885 [Sphingomonas sp. AP4-R1]
MATDFEYDLSAALPALRDRGGQQELITAIERALWVASAHQDLSDAGDALQLLGSLTKSDGHGGLTGAERSTAVGCLFAQAIILYARATETKPIEREQWFGREKLKGDDRGLHAETMELRNHALAHFGKAAEMADGSLVSEALVMRKASEGIGITFYSARAQNRAQFARRLIGLVEQVRSLAYDATQARYAALGTALAAASKVDAGVPALMRGFRFDPDAFCTVPGWIDAFRGNADTGAFTSHGAIEKPNA